MLADRRTDSSPPGAECTGLGWSSTGSILASGKDILREKLARQVTLIEKDNYEYGECRETPGTRVTRRGLRIHRIARRLVWQAQAGRDRPGRQLRVPQHRQLGQPHSVGERPLQIGGQMQRQPGFPDPATRVK